MTPFQTAQTYLALKRHFASDTYDIVKYKGKVSLSREGYAKRDDKYQLEKMARTMTDEEIVQFFIANFTTVAHYRGVHDDQSETRYKKWLAYKHTFTYNFGNEVRKLFAMAQEDGMCYNDVFFSNEQQHPPVLVAYLGKEISIETFIVLDRLNSFTKTMVQDVVTEGILRTARKYDPFLKVDLENYGNITRRIREIVFE
jgi:hypothetical protein